MCPVRVHAPARVLPEHRREVTGDVCPLQRSRLHGLPAKPSRQTQQNGRRRGDNVSNALELLRLYLDLTALFFLFFNFSSCHGYVRLLVVAIECVELLMRVDTIWMEAVTFG